ncbi:type II secretion system F family protein [Paraburkholderia acidipaludis]|uniref:type II secretion system F family protein n=1 Tax=Paraburkholderia acidipaludis TaxID=660537 RepID=UPI000485E247|nr:type II secretion system F family protein [Paraburkholderia acidipaludis]
MNAERLGVLALLLAALGFALLAGQVLSRIAAARRSARTLEQRFASYGAEAVVADARAAASSRADAGSGAGGTTGSAKAGLGAAAQGGAASVSAVSQASAAGASAEAASRPASLPPPARATGLKGFVEAFAELGARWLDTPAGRLIVAEEDRRVLDRCGYVDARSRGLFLVARVACATGGGALGAWLAALHDPAGHSLVFMGLGAVAGVMLPKLWLARRVRARIESVANELPMFVDLLRLLQGVGLSLDQSLQVMVNEFRRVLPVLAGEMEIAQRQFVAGRTREQSLHRMASIYENEDLRAVIRLIIQVDRHGGAVQEPLRQFGERLRDVRRASLRERIGRLTVKMTGVMVLTLLPALLIVTAGPGLISVMRALASHR